MSSRAIQRLREEREANKVESGGLDEIEEEEEEHDGSNTQQGAFLAMMDDSDSESEDEESSNDESKGKCEGEDEGETKVTAAAAKTVVPADTGGREENKQPHHNAGGLKDNEPELEQEEEDIDAILKEFEFKDETLEQDSKPSAPWFHAIVSNMDGRDLDIDYVMRTTLLGGGEEAPPPVASRRSRQTFLFGPARDGWVRPPHYVGGGIGMSNYFDQAGSNKRHLPWPYSSSTLR